MNDQLQLTSDQGEDLIVSENVMGELLQFTSEQVDKLKFYCTGAYWAGKKIEEICCHLNHAFNVYLSYETVDHLVAVGLMERQL